MQSLTIYFQDYHFDMVVRQKHEYFLNLIDSLKLHGFKVAARKIEQDTPMTAGLLDPYALLDNFYVDRDNCLTIRRAMLIPYWSFENSSNPGEFVIAQKEFHPEEVNAEEATDFARRLRKRKTGLVEPSEHLGTSILVFIQNRPRQASLTTPYFQLDMLDALREARPDSKIIISIAPENYLSDKDYAALEERAQAIDAQIEDAPIAMLMRKARFVATMNSQPGFEAMLWGVPTLLFDKADYHHVQTNVEDYPSVGEAVDAVERASRDFDAYLKWYLDENMINARKPDAIQASLQAMRDFGWPIEKL